MTRTTKFDKCCTLSSGRFVRVSPDGALSFCKFPGSAGWTPEQRSKAIAIVHRCVQRKERGVADVTFKFAWDSCAPTARALRESSEEKQEREFEFFVYRLLRSGVSVHVPVDALTR